MAPFASSGSVVSNISANFQNLQLLGEATGKNERAIKEFVAMLPKLIKEESYTLDQIFNLMKQVSITNVCL